MSGDAAVRWSAPDLTPPAVQSRPSAATPAARPGPSVDELAQIEKAARDEGFAAGRADGFAQGQAEVRRVVGQLELVLAGFSRPLAQLDDEVEAALGALAVRIAGNLLGRACEADPMLLVGLVRTALAQVGAGAREAEVQLHPTDLKLLKEHLPATEQPRLLPDPTLKRGELRVHTEQMRLDGSFAARLDSALAALRFDPPADVDDAGNESEAAQ